MSSQFIEIRNLGPIKELKFEVKRFGLVIGESAVGKSTLAKAIYLCKHLKDLIHSYIYKLIFIEQNSEFKIDEGNFIHWLSSQMIRRFEDIYCSNLGDYKKLYIKYVWTNKCDFSIETVGSGNVTFGYQDDIISEILSIIKETAAKKNNLNNADIPLPDFAEYSILNDAVNKVNKLFDDYQNVYYIPANRNALVDLTLPLSLAGLDNLDHLTGQYFKQISGIKGAFRNGLSKTSLDPEQEHLDIREDIYNILGGEYINENGFESFILPDNTRISMGALSSGQKDTIWLLYQLFYLLIRSKSDSYVIIEEPESHIFTSLQKKVMDVTAFFANQGGNGVFITTHSPYILLSANALYYAGHFTGEAAAKAEKIAGKDRVIQPDDLTAIQLLHDGSRDLIDTEENELRTGYIDAADEIHENYNKLIDLECFDDA